MSSGHPIALHVRCYGSGPPLLLIHGLGSSGDDWAFQIGPLAEHYQVIVPDLRGCGRSPVGSGAVSIAGFAAELWQLLDRWQLSDARIAGFSMGGAVALEMALQRPDATLQVVTINSLPSYRVDHWRKWLELNLQVGMVKLLGLPRTATMVGRRLFPEPHQLAMRQRVVEVLSATAVEPYLRCARALADWCAAERIDRLRTDLLMIAGDKDYTGLAEKQEWARRMGARLAVVAGSRHGTPFDAIQATNRCLLAFFGGQPLPEDLRIDHADEVPAAPPTLPEESAILASSGS
ncbi:MAG: alpha/beta fold hydrolase [Lysobacterales bacterium]